MGRSVAVFLCLLLPGCVAASGDSAPRNEPRAEAVAEPRAAGSFDAWLDGFATRARAAGVSDATLSRARAQMQHLPATVALDSRQSEFGARVWDYMDSAVTPARIAQGQAALRARAPVLSRIAARYGVPPEMVVAIWGIETSYGADRGRVSTLSTLATLAKDGRRGAFFEGQLIDALKIVQAGDIAPEAMIGSWAGAFGHTQFMPSSYLAYAVDFTGNGRRDLWSDDPADALASAANYLARRGWVQGQPWAVEVVLPAGFDLGLTGQRQSADAWGRAGLRAASGAIAPGASRLILPGGAQGPAFLAYGNYDVLKEYNISDAYVLALGHLSDRLRGSGPLQGQWPRGDRALNLSERTEMQRRLRDLNHYQGEIDGRHGPMTVAAVQSWQRANGLPPDGYINAALLAQMRR